MSVEQQAALVQLTQAMLADIDIPQIMQQAITVVADTLTVDHCAVWEFLSARSELVLRAGVGWQVGAVAEATIAVDSISPIRPAALGRTPAIIVDWHSAAPSEQPTLLHTHGIVSSLYVAIQGFGSRFGILSIDVTAQRIFSSEERSFVEAVANILALALDRGRVKQTLEQQIADLAAENTRLVTTAHDKAVMEERERLARDLHDSVTQALYGITLHAQAAWRLLAAGEVASAGASLHALQATAQEALDEMRLLIFELRPPILEQVGLVAALQARLNAVEGRAQLQTKLSADGDADLPSHVEQTLYRIALEALNNALKHAHAQHITVQVRQTQTGVTLEISDDGMGFDPAAAHATGGFGLSGIAERVARLGGRLTVRSAPGAGTQLRVEIEL